MLCGKVGLPFLAAQPSMLNTTQILTKTTPSNVHSSG